MVLLFAAEAFGACTVEDFQKELNSMQASVAELAKDTDKYAKVGNMIEQEYKAELEAFAKMTSEAAGDAQKAQAMLDKGCDLYARINKSLEAFK
jgi:hypothetical protein